MTQPNPALSGLVSDADHVSLSRLVMESAWRVDLGRAATLYELFVADRTYFGHEEIRAWGQVIEDTNPYPGIRHLTSNMRFAYTGTGTDSAGRDTAEGTTVLTVFVNDETGRPTAMPWGVGEDHDRFVRTEAGWRFTRRTWVQLFSRD